MNLLKLTCSLAMHTFTVKLGRAGNVLVDSERPMPSCACTHPAGEGKDVAVVSTLVTENNTLVQLTE